MTYDGQPVWENQAALDNICFSRELQPTLFSGQNNLKIRHYLRSAAIYYPGWDREYAQRLLEEFKLDEKKKICQLSKGQMSMVTILIALASRSPITILDEPAAGLDVVMRERFYQLLLDDFAQTGRTFLVSTHIIEDVQSVCDQIVVIDHGKILFTGTPAQLIQAAAGHVGVFWAQDAPQDQGLHITARVNTSQGIRCRAVADVLPPYASLEEPSLEDAYLYLISKEAAQ